MAIQHENKNLSNINFPNFMNISASAHGLWMYLHIASSTPQMFTLN
jgi:hypothetical protein